MRDFVRSQIDRYDGGSVVQVKGLQRYVRHFKGEENFPVNLSWVKTFYPDGAGEDADVESDRSYRIRFVVSRNEGENSAIQWYYPPTPEGKAKRNADLMYLYTQFTHGCPINDPTIPR